MPRHPTGRGTALADVKLRVFETQVYAWIESGTSNAGTGAVAVTAYFSFLRANGTASAATFTCMGPPYLRIFRTIYGSVFVAVAVAVAIAACGGGVDTPSTSAGALGAAPSVLPDGGGRSLFDKPAGCSHFTVVARDASGRQFLVINTDTKSLGISAAGDETTVDLATPAGARGTKVTVDTYATAPTESMYCTDWVASPQTPARATATRGKVTFRIAAVEREDKYAVTVSLSGVVVRAPDGSLETITDVTYTSIDVGWLPG